MNKAKEFIIWLKGYIDAKPEAIEDDLILTNLFSALGITQADMWKHVYREEAKEKSKLDKINKEFDDKGIQLTEADLDNSDFFDLEYLSNMPKEDIPNLGEVELEKPEWTEPDKFIPEDKIIITSAK